MKLPGWFVEQLGRPHGPLAPLFARILDAANRSLNLHMVGALDLEPGQRVLEVGFGGGFALRLMRHHEPKAVLFGAEVSPEMVARVRRALGDAVSVVEASVEALPYEDDAFDAVISANTIYFWPDVGRGLGELRRVLRTGGRLVLGVNPVERLRAQGFDARGLHVLEPLALKEALEAAGFVKVRVRRMPDEGEGTLLVCAEA